MADLRFATSGLRLQAAVLEGGLAVEAFAMAPGPLHLSLRLALQGDAGERRAALGEVAARLLRSLPPGQPWPSQGELTNALATLALEVARA
jgi:hypothetical protein